MEETGPIEIDITALPRMQPLAYEDADEQTRMLWDQIDDRHDRRSDGIVGIWMWNPELSRVRSPFVQYVKNSKCLPLRHREFAILRTAWKTGTDYIWARHTEIGLGYGLTKADIERVAAGPEHPDWAPEEAAVLRAVDELHDHCRIADTTWAVLAGMYDKAQLNELITLAGTYHIMAYTMGAIGMRPPNATGTSPNLPGNKFLFPNV